MEIFDITKINEWEYLKEYIEKLLKYKFSSLQDLKDWFLKRDELDAAVSEEMGWRYINMTRDTSNETYAEKYKEYVSQIMPKVEEISFDLNKKAIENTFVTELRGQLGYDILIKSIETEINIFRKENIQLFTETQLLAQDYSSIMSNMTINFEGEEITLQEANTKLELHDRNLREDVYRKIGERRLQDSQKVDDIFSKMIQKRNKIAKNASFETFTDYMFVKLKRFDYSKEDCLEFHDSVLTEVVPIVNKILTKRKEKLKLKELKPWDLSVDLSKKSPLKPFENEKDLLSKTIKLFTKTDPFFGECLSKMSKIDHLDLSSRKNKAPGGYNYPLYRTGVPFIFMNATHTFNDMITLIHEGGHAVHSFLSSNLELTAFQSTPMEVAEVASMSMELLTMDNWDVFFDNEEDLMRAKYNHLDRAIGVLNWVAIIDKFQHWIYSNPNHTTKKRIDEWTNIFNMFFGSVVNWDGLEDIRAYSWQRQLHLFEVPFYYIEYAISQLAAISIWKNYTENKEQGLKNYKNALKLGGTKSIPKIYEEAGIKFSFDREYIRELTQFIYKKITEIEDSYFLNKET